MRRGVAFCVVKFEFEVVVGVRMSLRGSQVVSGLERCSRK